MSFQSNHMSKRDMVARLPEGATNVKLVRNNTLEYTLGDERVIRHFDTDVLRFKADGTIVFNTNGHRSVTTKVRLNEYQSAVAIWTTSRVWYACAKTRQAWTGQDGKEHEYFVPNRDATPVVFADGMSYHPDRGFEGCGVKPDRKLVKAIRKYADDFADSLPCEAPGPGDCWICCIGPNHPEHWHLSEHVREDYFVPRLLHNALTEAQRGQYIFACAFLGDHQNEYLTHLFQSYRSQIAKDIYQYMYRRLIDGQVGARKPTTGFHA